MVIELISACAMTPEGLHSFSRHTEQLTRSAIGYNPRRRSFRKTNDESGAFANGWGSIAGTPANISLA